MSAQLAPVLRENLGDWPTVFVSPSETSFRHASLLSPLSERKRAAFEDYSYGSACVVALRLLTCPYAIFFAVWTIVVTSLKGHTFRFWTHVRIELGKFVPWLRNFDSSATVVVEHRMFGSLTSSQHLEPNSVNMTLAHSMFCATFIGFTSTRRGIAISERTGNNRYGLPTDALTVPFSWLFRCSTAAFDGNQVAKFFSGNNWFARSLRQTSLVPSGIAFHGITLT